ncbi:MAG TPA: acyl-CoA dehydrogenase family protein [Candidatus Binatia bacterium]|nr:acyl-CoA dehydrogenase family protein [Candidatus Binatia bacterium]
MQATNAQPSIEPKPNGAPAHRPPTEEESRRVAEESREQEWAGRTFLRELFLGNFLVEHVHPFPTTRERRPEFERFYEELGRFLREKVDPVVIDETGEYPEEVVDGLRRLGTFGMKIPREYGGLGLSVTEYATVMQMVGSHDSNVAALLSAHQSIGVPQPLKLFGTEEQKKKYLPRCAAGAISAFALTEPHVGSDPASLSTTAERRGDFWVLNGEKLWCTNGTLAELLVVMARDPATKKISCFIVETGWPGVKVEHRCRFMGLKALGNGVISFRDVQVPRENLVGEEGKGLKIALITLNTGRLTLPATTAGVAKRCVEICRGWSNARTQWGVPIWKHEAIAHKLADMAATTFAMDSVSKLAAAMADRGGYDIRLEAAAAKEWNTVRAWEILDETLQIRGGRGYERERSLEERGETPIPVERLMRDNRINLIFEGSSEIMHLFMAREAVDKHLEVAGAMIDPKKGAADKLKGMPGILKYYASWYPKLWGRGVTSRTAYGDWGRLATHLRFIERSARKLARSSFHGMAVYQAKMERKQGFLFRCVDVVMELFAMSAACSHARRMLDDRDPDGERAVELADLFCRGARRRVDRLFEDLWRNDDAAKNAVAARLMKGDHGWLERGILDEGFTPESFQTRAMTDLAHGAMSAVASAGRASA